MNDYNILVQLGKIQQKIAEASHCLIQTQDVTHEEDSNSEVINHIKPVVL